MKKDNKFIRLLTTCRVFSLAGIPVIVYFLYHDIAIYGYKELVYPRLFAILIMFIVFIFSFFLNERHYKLLEALYVTELTLIMAMSTFVVVQLVLRYKAPFEHISGAVQALMSTIFVILLFAQSVPDKLFIVYLPVFLVLPFLLAAGVRGTEISLIANPVVLCVVSIILGKIYDRFEKEEAKMKSFLAEQKKKLQDTVIKLEKTVAELNYEIERRKVLERQLKELSVKDPLTGIFNRRAAIELIEEAIERYRDNGEIFSVCFVDLDGLKKTNDKFGHEFGDKLIKTFSDLLVENVRKDDEVFRVGGDEFLLLFRRSQEDEVKDIMERIKIRAKIRSAFLPIPISFSYGIATYQEGQSLDDLISLADRRMYKQKVNKEHR